ncbi:MAG: T9SS type A sorting domain-containing protein [Bacteroidales bacterium]|nr:T9SS type A sorting domain-containing protein [Bacteroidales bacterium]
MKTRNFTKLISLLLLLVFAGGLKAQEYTYTPFPTENAQWSVNNEKYALHGDTIINEKKYSKVYKQTSNEAFEFDIDKAEYFCAIRNDVENKRVYGVYKKELPIKYHDNIYYTNRTSKKEFLLYDFSLNLGDTVSVANFDEAENDGFIRYVKFKRVETIGIDITNNTFVTLHDNDSIFVLANGEQRKRILMENISETLFQSWIEGIGSSDGPFNHYNNFSFELFTIKRLLCYNENDECLYKQSCFDYDENDDCFTNYYPDNVVENNENDIMIYPNPATTNVEVSYTLPEGMTSATLVMTNTLGVNVMTAQLDGNNGETTLSLEELPSGIYFYTIKCGENVKTGKLVKRN